MKGKERCKILKEIRQKIAEENGIEFITSECRHKGDCMGTCPKCESEVRYLERELEIRRKLGKSVAVAGIAASIALTGVGCADDPTGNELDGDLDANTEIEEVVQGDLRPGPDTEQDLMGEPVEFDGDIPYIDENGNEALLPSLDNTSIPGMIPEYFFPENPEEYDGYTEEFINSSMVRMPINEVKDAWGEGDMNQTKDGKGVVAYFTDIHDIVIQYDLETEEIINVTTIENE